jgi:hypothetical protein
MLYTLTFCFFLVFFQLVPRTYFIFVHGASVDATGSFELSVVKRPVIDTCEGSARVAAARRSLIGGQFSNVDNTTMSTVVGTLEGASPDTTAPTCGDSNNTSPGVWYTVIGTGGRMQAFFNDFETDFDARVSVFRGSCGSLACVELDDFSRWESTPGELYSMLVNSGDGSSGDFGLFVDVGNEFCTDLVNPLPNDNTRIIGTTLNGANASSIVGLPQCEASTGQEGAVAWFKVVGTGGTLRAASCNSPIAFDFTLYTGSCGNLTCVDEVQIGFDPYEGYGGFGSTPPCVVASGHGNL